MARGSKKTQPQVETWGITEFLGDFRRSKATSSSSYRRSPAFIEGSSTPRFSPNQTAEAVYPAFEHLSLDEYDGPEYVGDEYVGDYHTGPSYVSRDSTLDSTQSSDCHAPPPASTMVSYAPSESIVSSQTSYAPTVFSAAGVSITTRGSTPPPLRDIRPTAAEWMTTAPIPEAPMVEGPFLSCEFCDIPFFMAAHREWAQHVATQHLRGRYPPKAECIFCDETFKATSTSDRKANFSRRMAHIQSHAEAGCYGEEAKVFLRADWSLYGHLQRENILSDADSQRLMGGYVPKPKNLVPKKYGKTTSGRR